MPSPRLLLILASFLAAAVGYWLARPSPLARRTRQLEAELSQARSELAQLKMANEQSRARHPAPPPPQRNLPSDTVTVAIGSQPPSYRLTKLEELLLEKTYGPLMAKFELAPAELAHFKQLLANRRAVLSDITLGAIDRKLTQAQKDTLVRKLPSDIAKARAQSDAAIRHFLNNEADYGAYLSWEGTRAERLMLESNLQMFSSSGADLSLDQQQRIVELMSSIRTSRRSDAKSGAPVDAKSQYISETAYLVQQASLFLTPQQVDILKRSGMTVPR